VSLHPGVTDKNIQSIADTGFRGVRVDIFEDRVETQKGNYNFKTIGYDELNRWLKKRGITPYYILHYSNSIYGENRFVVTKGRREVFAKFVKVTLLIGTKNKVSYGKSGMNLI